MRTIHQFVAGFTNGDAISNEARVLRDIFQSWGYKSEIFSEQKRILPEIRHEARDVSEYAAEAKPDDIVLLHLSIGSQVNEAFLNIPSRRAILYHNVTPSNYLELINKQMANSLSLGRTQIKALAGSAEVNMADSQYNADELAEAGYKDVKVLPLVLDLDKLTDSIDKKTMNKYGDHIVNIVFVGRCVPNKKIEDVITAFYYFNKYIEPNSRLIHVGSYAGTERYYHLLLSQIKELNTDKVFFTKSIPQPQLNAVYKSADLFLSMSEHEGFCIPLIESMVHDVPILAYAAAAVPETLDGSGVLFKEKDYEAVAEMMGRIVKDKPFREAVLKGQQERIARYRNRDLEAELKTHLAPLLEP
ncbi:hypothetical protein BVX97_01145 [bacterium E08(2017)]|nr:hypothetical protein BVX97_01145 [bacterium E08(2017)]